MASQNAASVNQMKNQMKAYSGSISNTTKQQEYLISKIEDMKDTLAKADMGFEVGDTIKVEAQIEKLENQLRKLQGTSNDVGNSAGNAFDRVKNKIKAVLSQIPILGTKFKQLKKDSEDLNKGFSKTFTKGIGSIKKFALALLSVRTAWTAINRAAQSYLSYDTQLASSIQNSWNVLGSLLGPIIEYIASVFAKAVSYINAFVQALTGINLVARANAKAMDKQAKSAKKLNEAQSSLDEFKGINEDNGGSGQSEITTVDVDTSKLDILFDWIDKVKEVLLTIFEPFKNSWDIYGKSIIDNFIGIFKPLWDIVKSISESLMKWVISDNFQNALNFIFSILNDLLEYLKIIATWIADMYITYLAPVVDKILEAISLVIIAIGSIWNFLKPMIDTIIAVIMNVLEPVIKMLAGVIGGIIDALQGVLNFIIGIFTGNWQMAFEGIKQFLFGIIEAIKFIFIGLWETIIALFQGAWDIIQSIWGIVATWFNDMIIAPITKFFTGMWDGVKNGAKTAWESIKSVFSTTATWFKDIFNKAWTNVKNVFSVGGKIFDGIKDGIFESFRAVVNTLIKGINTVVAIPFNAINAALRTIKGISILGVSPFGFISTINVPNIPSLATGGVLTEETLVRVAEYSNAKSNPEIVSPKDIMKETFKEAIEESGMNQQNNQTVEVEVFGKAEIEDDKIVISYEKGKSKQGYNGGKNPSFAY